MSFLKRIIGVDTYDEYKDKAKICIPYVTVILAFIFLLTFYFNWIVLSWILNLLSGTSIIFLAYIAGIVLLFDKEVPVELDGDSRRGYIFPKEKPKGYKATKWWGIILIILAVIIIYTSNRYRKYYAFKCKTFLVEESTGTYHLKDGSDKKTIECPIKMKGYEIEERGYQFCITCEEYAEDTESAYNSERFFKR